MPTIKKARISHPEDGMHIAFMDYIRLIKCGSMVYKIANERKTSAFMGAQFKRQGVLAGVADFHIMPARCGFHSLYIEFKHGANDLSPAQKSFAVTCSTCNILHITLWDVEDAIRFFDLYILDDLTEEELCASIRKQYRLWGRDKIKNPLVVGGQ